MNLFAAQRQPIMKGGVLASAMVLLVAAFAQAVDVRSTRNCEIAASALEPTDFVLRALGGDRNCAKAADKSACCPQIQGLFSNGGSVELCMCNRDFFSTVVAGLPYENGVSSDDYVQMLLECGIPVAGRSSCPGVAVDGEVEPVVQSQILLSLLPRLLSGGATAKPSPPPAPKPKPPPPAPKPPVKPQAFGGKKGVPAKKFVTAGAPVAMVAAPVATVPAPVAAPVALPAPVPVPAPAAPVAAPAPVPVPVPVVSTPSVGGSFSGGSFTGTSG